MTATTIEALAAAGASIGGLLMALLGVKKYLDSRLETLKLEEVADRDRFRNQLLANAERQSRELARQQELFEMREASLRKRIEAGDAREAALRVEVAELRAEVIQLRAQLQALSSDGK